MTWEPAGAAAAESCARATGAHTPIAAPSTTARPTRANTPRTARLEGIGIELPTGARFTGIHFLERVADHVSRGFDTLPCYRPFPAVPQVGNAVRGGHPNVLSHAHLERGVRAQEVGLGA